MNYENEGLLHEMFMRQAKKTPKNVAIVTAEGRTMTFSELDEATDVLAKHLRILGVKPNSIVGIYMEKCLEYTVSYIAILKAGGAYLPLDMAYPIPLLEDIFLDAKPIAVCADAALLQFIPDGQKLVTFPEGWIKAMKEENSKHRPLTPLSMTLEDLAYTVYSSGTTGKPKGIQCPHRGAVFSYHHRHETYPYGENEREACNVFYVWEMLRPLLKGVPLYIIPDNVIYDPKLVCNFLKTNSITRMLFTPSLLEAVMDTEGIDVPTSMKTMRTILFCGEVVTTGLLERCITGMPWIKFVNLYSISESHDVACSDLSLWYKQEKANIKNRKFCPVGKLLPGVSVVIMNDELQPQPVGVPGEIYIGGPTLAVGYLNRPDLNSQRFIARPEAVSPKKGDRLYKAGDWGYMLSDGSFEICGRCDSMVKIRGYSIECQAVEAALLELSMVNASVVLPVGAEGEDKYLVAYIVPQGETTRKDVRAALKKRLPFYMVPSYFIFLSSIPILASSGKLDKKQLPPVDKTELSDKEGVPTTDMEKKLMPLWAEVLGLKTVDVQESFFDLGGHSLLAAKLLSKVKDEFGVQLAVKDLFIHSTVGAMGKFINAKLDDKGDGNSSPVMVAPTLDLIKEVERHDQRYIDMDIQLRAFWRSMDYMERWESGRVLLTGATGFLGVFLLKDLLNLTNAHIFCVVRETPGVKCTDRIRSAMVQFGILTPQPGKGTEEEKQMEAKFTSRVTAIKGDVGLMNMGMSEDDYMYLCTEIDFIIHAAAYVNLIYPYQALHGPNVLGTQNVLLFACTTKIKPLHYISTDGVFPHGEKDCAEDADMHLYASKLEDGYSQSKWVAEQLVRNAMDRGLPAAIYRPGNLSGDSKKAFWNPQDFNLLIIQACVRTGHAPDVEWDVDMTPVDFVSNVIVSLTQKMALGLGKIYHLTNPKPMKSKWLFEWIRARGYQIKLVPYTTWLQIIKESGNQLKDNGLTLRLLDTMISDESFFANLSTYTNHNVQKVLNVVKKSYPEINGELLKTYFSQLARRRVLPMLRKNTMIDKPLDGKVAIVTGASSGIGAAIAQQLAHAGALVALAARREEKLQALKSTIEDDGGVAISAKCDVTNKQQVKDLVLHTESTLGPVDILVNNAGVMHYTMMKNLKVEEWEAQIDLNCKGVVNCIGEVLDGMMKRKSGHIVNMSSNAGKRGFAGLAVYSATKFFVEGLSQGMRCELKDDGIKVTCIQPGDVKTELLTHTTDMEAKEAFDGSSSNKILEPEDVARAVLFAVSQPPYAAVNEILIEPRTAPI